MGEDLGSKNKARTGLLQITVNLFICKTKIDKQFSLFRNPARLFVLTWGKKKTCILLVYWRGRSSFSCTLTHPPATTRDGATPGNMVVQGKRSLLRKIVCCSRVCRGSTGGHGCVTRPSKALLLLRFPSSWAGGIPHSRPLHIASTFVSQAAAPVADHYGRIFKKSVEEPEQLWAEAAQGITWHKPWNKTMERKDPFSTSWWVADDARLTLTLPTS